METSLTKKKQFCVEIGHFNPPQNSASLFDMPGGIVCFIVGQQGDVGCLGFTIGEEEKLCQRHSACDALPY